MRVTIHHIVQTELTNLTIIGTSIVQAAIDLTVVNTSLSILTLTVDKVIITIVTATLLQIEKPYTCIGWTV